MSQQCALAAKGGDCILGCIKHSIINQMKEAIVLLYSALMGPHLEYCVQFWAPQYKEDVKIGEYVQRMAAKRTRGCDL